MPPSWSMALAWPSHPPYQASAIAIQSAITSPWQRRGAHRQRSHKVSPMRARSANRLRANSRICGGTRERRRPALDAYSMLGSRAPDHPRGRLATMALRRFGVDTSSCSRSRAWAQYSTRCSALAQMIALAGVTLVAAAALAWHRYTLLLSLTYSGGARWRSTRTRCSALGRLIALAGVTLAAAAVSAWSRYTPPLSLLCLGSAGCRSRRARRPHAITIALLTG